MAPLTRELARELNVADEDHLSLHASDIVGLPDHACFVRVRDTHAHGQREAGDDD